MAMMGSSAWSVQDHPMHLAAEDDFQQFLDMNGMNGMGNMADGLNYDFQDFQAPNGAHMMQAPPRDQLDTPMSGTDAPIILSRADHALQHQMPAITCAAPYQTIPTTMIPPATPAEAIVDSIDAQIQFLQQQKLQHQQRQMEEQQAVFFARQQNRMVPRTPQSLELQPGASQYYGQPELPDHTPQQQQAIDYRYQRLKEQQDLSFTPLVSPAVTPLETHFPIDAQFTVPGAYFSPLTSPALHAQNDPIVIFEHRHGAATTSSPGEMDLETTAPPPPNPGPGDLAKKVRKNAASGRKGSVKQSPISKPLRRKTATTPNLNAQVLSELVESVEQNQERQQRQQPAPLAQTSASSTTGATDSENGSVSPQALTDTSPIEMPPPPIPKPRSAKPSPYIAPQGSNAPNPLQPPRPGAPSPATPASLMKLSSPNNRSTVARAGSQEPIDTDHIETFELPESANFLNPAATPNSTQTPVQSPQEAGSVKTSNIQPLPSPAGFAKPISAGSASQSPQILPGASARKTPQLAPRGSKKRASVSSVHVSPALRPKISPSIKPLLPGCATAEETASHLLATKSNYQRILEGNTVPGVSYPSELSTNLTSKRTSHKIAEQGRRNRINSALQEIATLLPRQPNEGKGSGGEGDSGDKKDKSGNIPNSKASTVEMAIEYIKQLQKQVEEANRRAEEAERKLGIQNTE
ncbi:helix-loop-helix DNA-binding domain-containing protein [Diplogelasinospora grovesii]|uniref:Helix-loop-helix DNA-binding domain-containing protein n=1 Tax=Diplogelasinospora grovesii TaxID=303347 RepID=A0AAN6S9T2_9PEZI|nr:helix-loop-helix DNA-binding domain-containing protein [Diplogelasinospora grovesii]